MAELALAVVGTVEICIKLAERTLSAYRTFREADEGINDRVLRLEAHWTKLKTQLEFLSKISDQLGERLIESQMNLLQKLNGKLAQAISHIDEIPSSKYLRKLKFTLGRDRLDELLADLEMWLKLFDPTWYLIIRISDSSIDSALRDRGKDETTIPSISGSSSNSSNSNSTGKHENRSSPLDNMFAMRHAIQPGAMRPDDTSINFSINLDVSGLADATEIAIPFSTARAVLRKGTTRLLIAETVDCLSGNISQIKADVESLARRLKQIDPDTFGLLRCQGVLKYRDAKNHLSYIDMVYRTPQDSSPPTSLRQLLLEQNRVSASAIIKLAKHLVQSVQYIHTCDFVHKNIRPENVLIFPDATAPSQLGSSFLLGFNQFRNTNFQTNLVGDPAWHRNLYRHPQRQGTFVEQRYVMQHDIYSLGVCLLELGLWGSFVCYPNIASDFAPVPAAALNLDLSDADFQNVNSIAPLRVKDRLIEMTKRELPPRLGDIYTECVLSCLTCLDPGNEAFGSEEDLMDEDGILIGVKFVEKIVTRIADVSI